MLARGTLFIISAPSGGGKTSLVTALIKQVPGIVVSVSHTTRSPRVGEVEGENYYFVDESTFKAHQAQGLFLEHATVFNHQYGTSKAWVLSQLNAGQDVILEIDWQGARKVKTALACVSLFILPPSREVLLTRLQARRQDAPAVIADRMAKASNEIVHSTEYDYLVVNDDFDRALADIAAIVQAERLKMASAGVRQADLLAALTEKK